MQSSETEQRQMTHKHVCAVSGAPEFLDLVRDLLQDEHYHVTTTAYLPRTFDQIAALHPHVLLLDLAPAHEAGWNLLDQQQEATSTHEIPVIVTSTDPLLLERAEQALRHGRQRFLPKPFDIDDLLEAVQELTDTI
jgi:CheY-like chemotaxis protein